MRGKLKSDDIRDIIFSLETVERLSLRYDISLSYAKKVRNGKTIPSLEILSSLDSYDRARVEWLRKRDKFISEFGEVLPSFEMKYPHPIKSDYLEDDHNAT